MQSVDQQGPSQELRDEDVMPEQAGRRHPDERGAMGERGLQPGGESGAELLWMAALALLAVVVHASAFFSGFVFDDNLNIQSRGRAALAHIPAIFTANTSSFYGGNFYRPVLSTWCEVSYALFGTHAAAWHTMSVLLHVLCTLLVFRLAVLLVERHEVALTAAALFAVHPAQVEVVAWIAAVSDALMTALMLISILLFVRWMKRGGALWWLASFIAAAACILTKEPAVMLPLVLLATASALRTEAKPGTPVLRATIPFFVLVPIFLTVRSSLLHGFSHALTPASTAEMFYTLPAALLFYLRHLLWPTAVVPFYPLSMVTSWRSAAFVAPLAGVLAASTVLIFLLVRSAGLRRSCVCLAWIAAPLAPALYLKVFPPMELVHDRFLYAPLVGFCIAEALVLAHLAEVAAARLHVRVFLPVALGLIAVMSLQSAGQMVWWRNNRTLYTHALTVTPNSRKALDGLAAAYIVDGQYQAAAPLLRRSLEIDPQDANALFCLARMAWMQGDYDVAQKYLLKAIDIAPRYDMWLHLASVEMHRNQVDAAENAARRALAMSPGALGVHATLGAVLLAKGEPGEAASQFQQELNLYPMDDVARKGLARATAEPAR
jgi:4-amino-4-deoxy-L-arabinose transferase-like glycosyltransferase/predicted TPR repeat methyltransferase